MEKKVQHFVGGSAASRTKKIVKNVSLKDSSLSGGFGHKNQPCFKTLDMRNKTLGPYREVLYKGLTFFLDINSHAIFSQGLKNNNNIFTIGTYEAIMNGPHIDLSRSKESKEGHDLALHAMLGDQRETIKDKSLKANVEGTYSPEILTLDYKVKRREQRLVYVMPVTMVYEGKTYTVKTKDISSNGIKVFLPRTLIIPDREVQLTFDVFIKEQEEYADDSKKRFFKDVDYLIVDVEHKLDKTFISLIQRNLNDIAKSHINQFINANRYQYKLDANDVLLAAQARYTQHIYTHNLSSIPIFISKKDQNEIANRHYQERDEIESDPIDGNKTQSSAKEDSPYYIDHIIETPKNRDLINLFAINSSKSNFDFSLFRLAHRLEYFAKGAYQQTSSLLFVYWEKGKLYSVCDFEFQHTSDIVNIVLKIKAREGHIFCLSPKTIKHPSKESIKEITESLLIFENHERTQGLIDNIKHYQCLLMLTDVTDSFDLENYFSRHLEIHLGQESDLKVWTNDTEVLMSSAKEISKVNLTHVKPLKMPFNVQKKRYDTRYEHEMLLELVIQGIAIKSTSTDFSKNGVGVKFKYEANFLLIKNDTISVTFPEFNKKVKGIDFTEIEFKIASITYKQDQVILGLVRQVGKRNAVVGQFFEDLIYKNKTKLSICENDLFEQTLSQITELYIKNNINNVPLLIVKDKESGHIIKQVGLNQAVSHIAEHFFLKLRGYDFKILTSKERLKEIYNRTLKTGKNSGNVASQKDQSFVFFMYKETNESGREYINSYTSYDMHSEDELLSTLEAVFAHNGACIKFSFVNNLVEDSQLFEQIVNDINDVNRHISANFKQAVASLIGYVDMVDISSAYQTILDIDQRNDF